MDEIDPHLVVDRRSMTGANSSKLRDHNVRTILSHLREHGPTAGSSIAKALNLSAQTASVIVRQLEKKGIIHKLDPVKGKVGKPQTPVALDPDGAFSFGLRIGRRISDLVLINILGDVIGQKSERYAYPTPEGVEGFATAALAELTGQIPEGARQRIIGIGIAAPFELWNWLHGLGAPREEADKWRNYSIGKRYSRLSGLATYVANDVNHACMGELLFGKGAEFRDFVYCYIGSFVGGAVVLDGKVFHGSRGNAGSFGSIPAYSNDGRTGQLLNFSSIFALEQKLAEKHGRPVNLRAENELWFGEERLRDEWMNVAASSMARVAIAAGAVLDISNIVVDGVFPSAIRSEFVLRLSAAADGIDQLGIHPVEFHEGVLGPEAGPRGAAYQPFLSELLVEGSQLA